jgi:uncharacterized protein
MADRLKELLAELRAGYEAIYGDRLAEIVLYGSQARGDADSESDIDIMVVLRGPLELPAEWRRTDDFVDRFCLEHDVLVSPNYVPEDSFRNEQSPLLLNVRREGVPF